MKKTILLATLLLMSGLLAGCALELEMEEAVGTLWQWHDLIETDPDSRSVISHPEAYTLVFYEDGTFSYRADCNVGSGTFDLRAGQLALDLEATTRAECGPGSLHDPFLALLTEVTGAQMEDDRLVLTLADSAGHMTFVNGGLADIVDDSWQRIEAAGKIVVGTSPDYAPFAYRVGLRGLDGFDIALMNEIGDRLGIEVEYEDMAFDRLGDALQEGDVDAAIAAISITSERRNAVDFSDIYFVGEDAILAREGANFQIGSADDLASLRVGVQSGTVYEQWLEKDLVDSGLMPEDNLFTYSRLQHAVRDLERERIDLVMLDALPAEDYVTEGGVEIVGRGLNRQWLALALPRGAASLKTQIDEVLFELHDEGVIAELAEQYLDLDELLPTPTPGPACVDRMALVEEPDDDAPREIPGGQSFTKMWRVENTGTCTWDPSYRVVYADGNVPSARMSGLPTRLAGTVESGESYDLALDLVAPLKSGDYLGFWQLENGQRQAFGQRLPTHILVPTFPTATPHPTQTPAPGIMFTVDRTLINEGECVTFSWQVENVKEVYFYQEGQDWWEHGVTGEGSREECPPATTAYYLRVVRRDGTVETRQITIFVNPSANAPQITRFTVDPPGPITQNQCVSIRWQVEGNVNTVTLTANDRVLWDLAPVTGVLEDCPAEISTVTYAIEATSSGGTSRQQQHVDVVGPATATPAPTPAPDQPVIYAFSVAPHQVAAGDCVQITWSTGGGTTWVTITKNNDAVLDDAPLSGALQDCPATPGTVEYGVVAYNEMDQSVFDSTSVQVTTGQPQNPLAGTRWQAAAYYDNATGLLRPIIAETTLSADFGTSGTVDGSAGCNTYSARYLVNGAELNIAPPQASQMMCNEPPGIMGQESAYLSLLPLAAAYTIQSNELKIQNSDGVTVLEFIAPEPR